MNKPAELHSAPAHYRPDIHRLLPQSPDAEKGVLCSFLLAPEEVGGFCEEKGVTPEKFHIPAHGEIFKTLMDMKAARKPITFITLTELLRDTRRLDQCGGAAFCTELFTFLPTAVNCAYYIEILMQKSDARELIKVCTEHAARAYDEQDQIPQLIDSAEKAIMGIASHRIEVSEHEPIKETVIGAIQALEDMHGRKGGIGGVSTGFHQFDRMTDGLQKTDMIVIAARPSAGKTAWMMNVAEHITLDCKLAAAVFSLEMSKKQLMQRLLLSRARVNWVRFRDGISHDRDYPALTEAASQIATSNLIINDRSGVSIGYLRTALRRMMRKRELACAFIDYIQLLRGVKSYKGDNRQAEVAEISGGVKELAKELGIPIVVLAQLSRAPDARGGAVKGRPKLSDLRESGAIEQDADLVGLLHREEMYADTEEEKIESEGRATLIIAKARNGPTGDIPLTFLKEFTRFQTRAQMAEEPEFPKNRQPVKWT